MEKLEWKPVVGYEGLYEVSNRGDVRSMWRTRTQKNGRTALYRSKIINPTLTNRGYLRLQLCSRDGRKTSFLVHRIVAQAFIQIDDAKLLVNHKDGNQTNNAVANLEWVTPQGNQHHARDTGLHRCSKPVEAVNPTTGEFIRFPSLNVAKLALGHGNTNRIRHAAQTNGLLNGLQWSWAQ